MMIRSATARRLLFAAALLLPTNLPAAPPVARVEPVTDDYYGTKVTDPYRWMESGKDPQWMPWLKGQAEHTRSVLDRLPGRAQLLADIGARTGALPAVSVARSAGPYLFIQERLAGAQDFRLVVREGKGPARVLYAPGTGEGAKVIDGWSPSPDGRHVAVQLSKRGTERSIVHVIETATGRMGPERISDAIALAGCRTAAAFPTSIMSASMARPLIMLAI
jgi:prolyl oligopeptidase